MKSMKLLITQSDSGLISVEESDFGGAPFAGRGKDIISAIGSFFHNNQEKLGIEFIVADSAKGAEQARRIAESNDH